VGRDFGAWKGVETAGAEARSLCAVWAARLERRALPGAFRPYFFCGVYRCAENAAPPREHPSPSRFILGTAWGLRGEL